MSSSASTSADPSFEEVKGYSTEQLITYLRTKIFNFEENDFTILRNQRINGQAIVTMTQKEFSEPPFNFTYGLAKNLSNWIAELNSLNNQKSYSEEIKTLKFENFYLRFSNTQNSASLYRLLHFQKDIKRWEIEMEIDLTLTKTIGDIAFREIRTPPEQGSKETEVTQPFCVEVVKRINEYVGSLESNNLYVFGDSGGRLQDEVYPDIIIGLDNFYCELTARPPDLSKGLGWEVKNDLRENSKVIIGKGQLIKYARAYLFVERPLTNIFYGCLTDGKLWHFVKIKLLSDDFNNLNFNFEESIEYEWNEKTASIIAGIISCYRKDLLMKASGEKKESRNNNETYFRNRLSISTESLLASFIEEGIYMRLINSEKYIHVQIISHLGTGRSCLVFLAQVRDYGIKDAVLKIEIRKDIEFNQLYHEISALHALSDLSCVPKILFEGYTVGESRALLTDFAGQPLESWIVDNGSIDDYTIFQIILDLLSRLTKIHAHGYTHGDVAIRNVIRRNGHFYLIDFGLATLLQLHSDPRQAIIRDYSGLCQIIGTIKFGKEMTLSELIYNLEGELKSFVMLVENASEWKITDERMWLEKFGTIVKQTSSKALKEV